MSGSFSEIYKSAGVDITAGYKAVDLMKPYVKSTFIPGVLGGIGGFGGLFQPDLTGISEPVLVSGTDGVGTKLKIAFLTGKFDTVGIDCVAMCVNDVVCAAAKPLFFLDYIAVGKNRPEVVADIVKGVSAGCIKAGCALIGGETAEMPGFYPEDEFDLAGFCVGLADKKNITDCASIRPGDVIVGMPSTGVHSNGFSLVRKLLVNGEESMKVYSDELGMTVGEALLTPTEIYVKPLLALMESVKVKGAAHITGGGFYENIPRSIPDGLCAKIDKAAVKVLPIFDVIAKWGNIPERDMYNTYNMGVGMMVAVDAADADKSVEVLRANGIKAEIMGVCKAGETGVELK